jgi:RNA polymerase sigma factor (sigma-70 family)
MAARPTTLLPLLTKTQSTDAGRVTATDRELLRRFARDKDEAAFAALVHRHGPMVLGVCRRVLGNSADAEDACQATFLVLARKAAAGWQPSVASWLYVTARRVALNARTARSRRAKHEGRARAKPPTNPLAEITGEELLAILDEELGRLTQRYRAPVVLCCLEGLTRDEAARQLGIPAATLKGQLERGRRRLHDALARRGVSLGAGLLALMATSRVGASPPRFVEAIRAAAAGKVPPTIAALADGIAVNGLLKKALAILALAGVAAFGLGLGTMSPIAAEPPKPVPEKSDKPAARADPKDAKPKPELSERTITGKVLGADGKPVVAELFMNWVEGKSEPLGKTQSDGSFRVIIPLKEWGGWLTARAKGHGMDFVGVGLSKETPAEVTLRLPKDQPVRGSVIDPQGKPLAGVRVTVDSVTCYDTDSLEKHLKRWTEEFYGMGIPPGGDRSMWYRSEWPGERERESPVAATTDADGKFELAGVGAGQQLGLTVRGPGIALTRISVMNRAGFDPKPYVESADKNATLTPGRPGRFAQLFGPGPQIIVEREKVIRGRVTAKDTGKPMAGVPVAAIIRERLAYPAVHEAVTDKDGRYEIHGARKHAKYFVECRTDARSGYFWGEAEADDTAGYTPIELDVQCWRGVIVTGTVIDKGTGKPLSSVRIRRDASRDNPSAKDYPAYTRSGEVTTAREGRFRFVTIPGPVQVQALILRGPNGEVYRPAKLNPKDPSGFKGLTDARWSKLIEAKEADRVTSIAIELEPAPRMAVKVVNADGKPAVGAFATGLTEVYFDRAERQSDTNTLTVYNVEPGQERLLAVVDAKNRLVGTQVVRADDKDPVVKLGPGGTASGRVVDADGKPIAGMTVNLYFTRREVTEACEPLNVAYEPAMRTGRRETTTDANGEFRFDALFPVHEFRLIFSKGKKSFGPAYNKAPRHTLAKHGDTLKLGNVKVEPRQNNEPE